MYTRIISDIICDFLEKNPNYDNGNMEIHLNIRTFSKRIRYEMPDDISVGRKIIKSGGHIGFCFMGIPLQINNSIPEDFLEFKSQNGVSLACERLFPKKINFLFADGSKSTDIMHQG